MSSLRSKIAANFASHPGSGNRASCPFFLAMAYISVRYAINWLERAEADRQGTVHPAIIAQAQILAREIKELERRSRREFEVVA